MEKGDYLDDHGHWRVVLENRIGASSPPWITPKFYFLPFEWNTTAGNASDLRSANTWRFGANLTCELLAGDVYGKQSSMGLSDNYLGNAPAVALNVTIPMANGTKARCSNLYVKMTAKSIVTGRFAGEYLFGLRDTDRQGEEAGDLCDSFLVMGWNRGSVTLGERNDNYPNYIMNMSAYENTTILCTQQIFSAEFSVVVDSNRFVQMFKRLTPFSYDNSSLFNHSTTIVSFKARLSTIIWSTEGEIDTAAMHNDKDPRTLPSFLSNPKRGLGQFCDPSAPPPSFGDAKQGFQDFYSWRAPRVIGQKSESLFRSTTKTAAGNPRCPGR